MRWTCRKKALEQALLAGYDEVVLCDSFDIPFADRSFDYIVSLDVLGHIENEVKDVYLNEWKRLLKESGVMLHGTEADDVDYYSLSEKEKEHKGRHLLQSCFDSVYSQSFKDLEVSYSLTKVAEIKHACRLNEKSILNGLFVFFLKS